MRWWLSCHFGSEVPESRWSFTETFFERKMESEAEAEAPVRGDMRRVFGGVCVAEVSQGRCDNLSGVVERQLQTSIHCRSP